MTQYKTMSKCQRLFDTDLLNRSVTWSNSLLPLSLKQPVSCCLANHVQIVLQLRNILRANFLFHVMLHVRGYRFPKICHSRFGVIFTVICSGFHESVCRILL